MKKFFALAMTAMLVLASAVPAFAADEKTNVSNGSSITLLNFKVQASPKFVVDPVGEQDSEELGAQVLAQLTDGLWGLDAANYACGDAALQIVSGTPRVDVDGVVYEDGSAGSYIAAVQITLPKKALISEFYLVFPDTYDAGAGTDDFLYPNFDIAVSATGAAGSWKVVHEARDLLNEDNYLYEAVESEDGRPGYAYTIKLDAPVEAAAFSFNLVSPLHHNDATGGSMGKWFNAYEFAAYGTVDTSAPADTTAAPADTTAAPADTTAAPADTTAAPADTTAAPVTQPTTPTAPEAPATFDFVVVPAAIAAASAGLVLVFKRKK